MHRDTRLFLILVLTVGLMEALIVGGIEKFL
jgi:hypothetical protein